MEDGIENLSDVQLKDSLASYGLCDVAITDQTREVYQRKLKKIIGQRNDDKSWTEVSDTKHSTQTPDNSSDIKGYYGVSIVTETSENVSGLSPFYDNRADAVKAAKSLPGSRFKRFDTPEDAEAYSMQPQTLTEDKPEKEEDGQLTEKDYNPLSSVKTKEKNRARKLIEGNKITEFVELIWTNPKYLIGSGDNPEIYHEGTRRNALHCAVDCGNLEFCKTIFEIIQSDQFWQTVYPLDDLEARYNNREHLVNLYLNMQDGTERSRVNINNHIYLFIFISLCRIVFYILF